MGPGTHRVGALASRGRGAVGVDGAGDFSAAPRDAHRAIATHQGVLLTGAGAVGATLGAEVFGHEVNNDTGRRSAAKPAGAAAGFAFAFAFANRGNTI